MKTIDTHTVTRGFTDSIVNLQEAKGYTTQEAYFYLAGYLGSQLASVIDQLPKGKRLEVLADMERTILEKNALAKVLAEVAA